MNRIFKTDRRWIWIVLGSFMILLRSALGFFPEAVETYYSRGFFSIVRYFGDYTISLSPVPVLYLAIVVLIGWWIFLFVKNKSKKKSFKSRIVDFIFSLAAFAGALVFFFLLLWGFNYCRIPLEEQLGIDPQPLSREQLNAEFMRASALLTETYSKFELAKNEQTYKLAGLENDMRAEVIKTLRAFELPTPGRVRARLLKPKGILLRISTAGVYLPWVGECHVDAGLHPLQIPNVMAHELAHGYGITDEGACNFIALHAGMNSANPFYQYSSSLSYWKSVASNYKRAFPEAYQNIRENLPPGILEDIISINDNLDRFPDFFPDTRDFLYNNYLKSQGIAEGLQNYSRVILLEVAYQNSKNN